MGCSQLVEHPRPIGKIVQKKLSAEKACQQIILQFNIHRVQSIDLSNFGSGKPLVFAQVDLERS